MARGVSSWPDKRGFPWQLKRIHYGLATTTRWCLNGWIHTLVPKRYRQSWFLDAGNPLSHMVLTNLHLEFYHGGMEVCGYGLGSPPFLPVNLPLYIILYHIHDYISQK